MSAINSILPRTVGMMGPLARIAAISALLGMGTASASPTEVPLPGGPRIDRLPTPANTGVVDIAAIARGYEAAAGAPGLAARQQARLLIFVSFSMPPASLTRLAGQARMAGGVLLLNGLKDGSLPATARAIHDIFGKEGAPLQIDPRAFSRYAVNAVPAFVLRSDDVGDQSCVSASCPDGGYAMATGDVSADYALEQMAGARPALRAMAHAILRRMGK